ncbi:hypothetical protein [Pelagicoccus albus]|uniref:Uncharacterized protein n=1 Tax=Pelagicoccus albus TaxID=415222 RepID=A0A7X1B5I3_9BACT|nr:hypothetical protein [Pelagicoccus albus]MBC2605995.1 hypothetical protein [Pelagicoccus albus]
MSKSAKSSRSKVILGCFLLFFGLALIAFGWLIPSRFKSIPFGVVSEAGQAGDSLTDKAKTALLDGNLGTADLLAEAAKELGDQKATLVASQVDMELEFNAQLERWGAWDPFLEAALKDIPVEEYSTEPGFLGVLLAKPNRSAVAKILENSRNPMVRDLLATGSFTTYKRLFPVQSTAGRPLEVCLLSLGLLAQGDHFTDELRIDLREHILEAKASGAVGELEDFYLDCLSLIRIFNWGQLKEAFSGLHSLEAAQKLRFLLHKRSEEQSLVFAMTLTSDDPDDLFAYLERYGDEGFERLKASLAAGVDGYLLALREQLPIEEEAQRASGKVLAEAGDLISQVQDFLAPYSLRNPELALGTKYGLFFIGSFTAFWGFSLFGRFYREKVSPVLALTQRVFGASASVIVFAVLSEPFLASSGAFEGYNFSFVMPVLTNVDGELQIVETTPTTSMESATLLSIAFFFVLQCLVFLICMLKVREIDRRIIEPLVKLRLMENEENLFDSGLYVGIAGTCISLVMQVIGLVDANLLAAYSSNLFGILCVAIVKIRLVRPYKTRLIIASESQIAHHIREE